ncbi:MAG: GYDIA family GHMP kinase [Bacteroidales bacterium]
MKTLYAHGKLLISAEYMVMFGSSALAVPLQRGQFLKRIRSQNRDRFVWNAFDEKEKWFHAGIDPVRLKVTETTDPQKAGRLISMLKACIELMPSFQKELFRWDVETVLEFSPDWGFGSSSTLTALLAEWAEVNPLDLHFMTASGSGYDVACAIAEGPILYKIRDGSPHYRHIPFHPPFSDQIYFAWLGHKQDTRQQLDQVSGKIDPGYEWIHRFSRLTEQMIAATDPATFGKLMEEHEEALSGILEMETISDSRFSSLPGYVKSLGAWGGDFVMIVSRVSEKELFAYLHDRNIRVIFRYDDLVYDTNLMDDLLP